MYVHLQIICIDFCWVGVYTYIDILCVFPYVYIYIIMFMYYIIYVYIAMYVIEIRMIYMYALPPSKIDPVRNLCIKKGDGKLGDPLWNWVTTYLLVI